MTMTDRPRDYLERPGQTRLALQRDMAMGALSPAELRVKYNATASALKAFRTRHADTIAAIAADINNRFAGLWIADKEQRVAAYQADVDLVDAEVERVLAERDAAMKRAEIGAKMHVHEMDEDGELLDAQLSTATDLGRLSRIKHRALRSVAEELGQLPTRMIVKSEGGGAVHVYGSGVDTDKV